MEQIDVSQAFPACREAMSDRGDDPVTIFEFARVNYAAGQKSQALSLYLRAYRLGHVEAAWSARAILAATEADELRNAYQLRPIYEFLARRGEPWGLYYLGMLMLNGDAGFPHGHQEQTTAIQVICKAAAESTESSEQPIRHDCVRLRGRLAEINRENAMSNWSGSGPSQQQRTNSEIELQQLQNSNR